MNKTKKIKGPDIGLRQAKRLCQLPGQKRLELIAEGLPIVLGSAQGFWAAAQQISEHSREAEVLKNFSEEEAAKILILMDVVRCPPKLISSKINKLIEWFYDHLARLIYAEAVRWKPMHLSQLREYVDQERRGHYLEGYAEEYIMPNWTAYERESRLYADVQAHEDDALSWNAPHLITENIQFDKFMPPALRVSEAMQQLGLFTFEGLKATSEIWGSLEYKDQENNLDGEKLTEELLARVHKEGLILDTAQKAHVSTLYQDWQIPMYNLDFSLIPVSLEELKARQEQEYWSMVGDPRW